VLIKILMKHYGYVYIGTRGSHAHLEDSLGHKTTILLYPELYPKVIKWVLSDTGLSWEDIERYI
jgi:predicted RNA binding protein YcfA (HicA-like mRNA interferase family)